MPEATEAIEPPEIEIGADMSEAELSDLIEVADASVMAFRDTEGGRLMDSIAIGTGFDIAMTQQGLLPALPSIDVETATPDTDLATSCPTGTAPPTDACDPTFTDTYVPLATYQTDLDPLVTHHQHD